MGRKCQDLVPSKAEVFVLCRVVASRTREERKAKEVCHGTTLLAFGPGAGAQTTKFEFR